MKGFRQQVAAEITRPLKIKWQQNILDFWERMRKQTNGNKAQRTSELRTV